MRRLLKCMISTILALAMLLESGTALCYAIGSSADEPKPGKTMPVTAAPGRASGVKEVNDETVLYETSENRSEYTKDYRLTDGSNAVFLYPVALHEKEERGDWIEIDNRLAAEVFLRSTAVITMQTAG